jgi:hypothetical protein
MVRGSIGGWRGALHTAVAALRVWLIIAGIWLRRAVQARRASGEAGMNPGEMIRSEVTSWPGVEAAPHRYGGVEFRLGKRELGHLHGDYLADLPFPVRVRAQLVAEGKAMPHHILPASGWVSYPIRDAADVPGALALFRLAYERATATHQQATKTVITVEEEASA